MPMYPAVSTTLTTDMIVGAHELPDTGKWELRVRSVLDLKSNTLVVSLEAVFPDPTTDGGEVPVTLARRTIYTGGAIDVPDPERAEVTAEEKPRPAVHLVDREGLIIGNTLCGLSAAQVRHRGDQITNLEIETRCPACAAALERGEAERPADLSDVDPRYVHPDASMEAHYDAEADQRTGPRA